MKLLEALPEFDPRMLKFPETRRELGRHDPLMWAFIYMREKLFDESLGETASDITLNAFHLDVIDYAKSWSVPLSKTVKSHDCFIAPRQTGKSTWMGMILPLWCAAYMHKEYLLLFSDSDTQARKWLINFKMELSRNQLIKSDFPELVNLLKYSDRDRAFQDNANVTQRGNGFIFQVAGADNSVLGANIDGKRPQIILFDDIEPTESNYSPLEVQKRKNTILGSHFALNQYAIKAFIGTTTMPDALVDQMRKVAEYKQEWLVDNEWDKEGFKEYIDPEYHWIVTNDINVHYWPAIIESDGIEQSLWPEKWTMDYLNSLRGTREFAMNFMNRPVALGQGAWEDNDIIISDPEEFTERTIISVDPAVTSNKRSDYTGIVVASRGLDNLTYIRHAEQRKFAPDDMRHYVFELIKKYDCKVLYIETNQGGDVWESIFTGVPCKFRTVHQREKKELRHLRSFDVYKKGQVRHTGHFPALVEQMLTFPNPSHDDVLDAASAAVLYFNSSTKIKQAGGKTINYLEGDNK